MQTKKIEKIDIYIGTIDKTTKQPVSKTALIEDLHAFFRERQLAFSVTEQLGGYLYNNQEYTVETSFRISLIGLFDPAATIRLLEDFKTRYGQESVLMVRSPLCSAYV